MSSLTIQKTNYGRSFVFHDSEEFISVLEEISVLTDTDRDFIRTKDFPTFVTFTSTGFIAFDETDIPKMEEYIALVKAKKIQQARKKY